MRLFYLIGFLSCFRLYSGGTQAQAGGWLPHPVEAEKRGAEERAVSPDLWKLPQHATTETLRLNTNS